MTNKTNIELTEKEKSFQLKKMVDKVLKELKEEGAIKELNGKFSLTKKYRKKLDTNI